MRVALAIALSLTVAEIAIRLPLADAARRFAAVGRNAVRILGARDVSDDWKERAALRCARDMMAASVRMAMLLVVLLAAALVLALVFEWGFPGFLGFVIGWTGLLVSVAAVTLFLWVRRHV